MSKILTKFKSRLGTDRVNKADGSFSPLIAVGAFNDEWARDVHHYYGFDWGAFAIVIRGRRGVFFYSLESYVRTMQVGWEQFRKDGKEMPLMRLYNDVLARSKEFSKQYKGVALDTLSDGALRGIFAPAFELSQLVLSGTIFSEELNIDELQKIYGSAGGNPGEFDEFFKVASAATFESFALRLDNALVAGVPAAEIQPLFADYFTTPSVEILAKRLPTIITTLGGVQSIQKEIDATRAEIAANKAAIERIRSTLAPDLAKVLDFVQLCMWLRDIRKEAFNDLFTLVSNAARELCRRQGVDQELAPYVLGREYASLEHWSDEFKAEIAKRASEGCAFYLDTREFTLEYGDTESLTEQFFKVMEGETAGQDIKGSVAYRGIVRARAQVILSERDFASFEKGSVLVTSMTRPEFVPLMKLASAIVTDEGGVTCHAAIVSRELKKPCIIGTRNATRVLKTGDMVEVDAEKGIVRIISTQ